MEETSRKPSPRLEGFKRWSTSESKKAQSQESIVSKAIPAPGIPLGVQSHSKTGLRAVLGCLRWSWLFPWIVAMLTMSAFFVIYAQAFRRVIWEKLPANADISIYAKGCDVHVDPNKYSTSLVKISWWTSLGDASAKINGTNVQVNAVSSRRSVTWRCTIDLFPNDKYALLNSLKVSVDPSHASEENTGPSNVAEIIHVELNQAFIRSSLTLDVKTFADVRVIGVQVPAMTANIVGGLFSVHEVISGEAEHPTWLDEEYRVVAHVPRSMNLNLKSATVVMNLHNVDLRVQLAQDTVDDAILAGARVKALGEDTYQLSRSTYSEGPYVSVALEANDCAIYLTATDEEHYFGKHGSRGLEVHRGTSTQSGPRLLPVGVAAMKQLAQYLNKTATTAKFIVYFDLSAPHAPPGTFRLLSTKSYLAFSTWFFVMMSAGMLNPQVIRITTPLVGLDFLFPRTLSEGPLSKVEQGMFIKGMFDAVTHHIDISKLGKPRAEWVWDPIGPDFFLFEPQPGGHGKLDSWSYRSVTSSDTFSFYVCSIITALLGLIMGSVLCKLIVFELRPYILTLIRDAEVAATSTYQLKYQVLPYDWNVNSTFVTYPLSGLLLRWGKRSKQPQFAVIRIVARQWPLLQHGAAITTTCDPARLPSPPNTPDQQAFLFPSRPRKMVDRKQVSTEAPAFDYDDFLAGTAKTVFSDSELSVGCAYIFKLEAFDNISCVGKPIDISNWTRPVYVKCDMVCTEYPLMLWKSLFEIIPADPFRYFLDMHCVRVQDAPSMILTLSSMRLVLMNGSILFGGDASTYGQGIGIDNSSIAAALHRIGSDEEKKLSVVISTGSDEQLVTDVTYESTGRVRLPGASAKERTDNLKTFKEVTGQDNVSPCSEEVFARKTTKHLIIDFDKILGCEQTIRLRTGQDLDQIVRFEAVLGDETKGDDFKHTGRYQTTWKELLTLLYQYGQKVGDAGVTQYHVCDQLVMRDGLSPVAFLMCDVGITNSAIPGTLPKASTKGSFPQIFENVLPGCTILWGETLTLHWHPCDDSQQFDIVIITRDLMHTHMDTEKAKKKQTLLLQRAGLHAGNAHFKVSPRINPEHYCFQCYFQATATAAPDDILATSARFVVVKPVTLQQLELGYASFCVRNQIPMLPFGSTRDLEVSYGFDIVERTFSIVNHYRIPLPIKGTGEPEADAFKAWGSDDQAGPPLVANSGSYLIVGNQPLKVRLADTYEVIESISEVPDAERGIEKQEKIETLPVAVSYTIDIPTNLYWRHKGADWSSEILLLWGFLPTVAREGWLSKFFIDSGFPTIAKSLWWVDNAIRFFLQMFLWWFQMLALLSPIWLLLSGWMWHDNLQAEFNPNMGGDDKLNSLFDFLIHPSLFKWDRLQRNSREVLLLGILYSVAVFALTLYGNFVHHVRPIHGLWIPLDFVVSTSYMAALFALAFYASTALCWIMMGSLINPEELMPYALMTVGVMVIIRTNWNNLQGMKKKALDGLTSKLDIVTRAIMTIFIGKAGVAAAGAAVDARKSELIDYAEKVVAYLRSVEKSSTQLYWQSRIQTEVDAIQRDSILLLRESSGFKAGIAKDLAKNQVYSTDFVPQKYWLDAQERANNRHLIAGTRKPALDYLVDGKTCCPDELITGSDLYAAMAIDSLKGFSDNASDADEVQILAKKLGLRPKTAEMVHQAFGIANNTAASKDASISAVVNAPLSIGPVMASVREEQFFKLWLHKGISAEDMKNKSEQASTKGSGGTRSIGMATIHRYIIEMDKKELENLNAVVAHNLTEILDWTAISRKCAAYATSTLPNYTVIQKIEKQLNPAVEGSAACRVRRKAAELVFANFEEVYCKDPVQLFVDCDVIEAAVAMFGKNCKEVLTSAVNNFRLFDGSIDQIGLLKALEWLIMPAARTSNEGPGGVVSKMYLWKDALVSILKDLGWDEGELEDHWLTCAWMRLTKDRGVLPYEDLSEISVFICNDLAEGGLWKAAMKTVCFQMQIGGFMCCDIEELGLDKASELAHTIRNADNTDLSFLNDKVRWPAWVIEIWNTHAVPSSNVPRSGSHKRPSFLQIHMIDEFLHAIVYQSVDKETEKMIEKVPLNQFPDCADDLQWHLGEDHSIWQVTPDGNQRVRGIWLELFMGITNSLDCLPNDVDLYLNCLKWQLDNDASKSPSLTFESMRQWLVTEYIDAQRAPGTFAITFRQFHALLANYLDFDIRKEVLRAQVFNPCPTVPDDDLGELRYAADLGAALHLWIGFGLWKGAVKEVIKQMCPRGAARDMALKLCADEFDKLDIEGTGILQPGQVKVLLHKLLHPGLTLPEVNLVVQQDLGLNVPEREVHKYFCLIDVNGDGVLQATEFVAFIRVIMTSFYPKQIVDFLGFSTSAILKVIATLVACLIGLFIAATLVIKSFTSGPVAATIHSSCSAGSAYMMKLQGEMQTGAGQAASEVVKHVDALVMTALTGLLGLTPTVIDELKQLFSQLF